MICCVEDDDSIRELMVYTLQMSGFEAYRTKLVECGDMIRTVRGVGYKLEG